MKQVFTLINSMKALGLVLLMVPSLASGQIAAWDFFGVVSATPPTTFTATTFNANLVSASSANAITRGAGAIASGANNSFRTTGFQNNGISTANTDYFQVTLKAAPCYNLSLSTIDAKFNGTATFYASTGVNIQFAYSLDGSTFTLIGSPVAITTLNLTSMPSISLSAISALQNVPAGTTVTIRFYSSGQTTTGGWGFQSGATAGTNGLAIGGTVASAPTYNAVASTNWTTASTWGCGIAPTTTSNVTIPTGITVVLDAASTVNNITFTGGGKLTLGANDLTATGIVTGDATAGYVVTNGAGKLTRPVTPIGALFPIGQSATSYDPVFIKPASTQSFGAKVGAQTTALGTSPMNGAAVVNAEWDITGTAGTVDLVFVSAALNKDGSATRPTVGTTGVIGHFSGGVWEGFVSTYAATNTWAIAGYTGTFSPFLVAGPSAVLAVDLKSLDVKLKDNKNVVNWSTASEKNNAQFDVQHATNGRDFRTIGTVKGNGTTNAVNNYTFEDATPAVGTNYYRLNQIDANGAATLSKVVSIQFGGKKGELKAFPTLAFDKVTVLTNSDQVQDFSISNLLGQTVLTGRLTNGTDVTISALTKGIYILKVAGETVKFSKQ